MKPNSAMALVLAHKNLGVKPSDVDYRYTWLPGLDGIYVGRDIKTSWLHSLWVGVILTLLSIPAMLVEIVLLPALKTLWRGFLVMLALAFARLVAGLTCQASGIVINEQSLEKAIVEKQREAIMKMMGVGGIANAQFHVIDTDKPDWQAEVMKAVEADKRQDT